MSSIPAGPPPPDENAGPRIIAATLIVTSLALITSCGRAWVRLRIVRGISSDDVIMFVTMLMAIVGQVLTMIATNYGGGRHMMYIPPQDIPFALKINFVTQPLYVLAITMTKFSIGMYLLRLTVEKVYRQVIIGTIVFMWVYTLMGVFLLCLQCSNIAALWDLTVKAKCLPPHVLRSFSYTNSVLCIVTDLMFSVLIPVPMLWKVQISWRNKTKVLAILSMSLGLLATSASIVKLSYIPSFGKTGDWLWDSQNLAIWTIVECCVGIVAGNVPILRQLVSHVLGTTTFGSSHGRSGNLSAPRGRGASHAMGTFNTTSKRKKLPGESDTELVADDNTHGSDMTPEESLREEKMVGGTPNAVQRNNSKSITKTMTSTVSYGV